MWATAVVRLWGSPDQTYWAAGVIDRGRLGRPITHIPHGRGVDLTSQDWAERVSELTEKGFAKILAPDRICRVHNSAMGSG